MVKQVVQTTYIGGNGTVYAAQAVHNKDGYWSVAVTPNDGTPTMHSVRIKSATINDGTLVHGVVASWIEEHQKNNAPIRATA